MPDDSNKPFTFTSQQDFQDAVMNLLSPTLNAKFKQFKKEALDDFQKEISTFGGELDGKFTELTSLISNKRDKKGAGKPGEIEEPEGGGPAPDPHMRTLQKQVEELTNANKRTEELRQAEVKKNQQMKVQSRLREVLESNGVTNPHKVKGAMAVLVHQERKVGYSDAFDDAAWLDDDGAPIELDQSVRTWLSTEEGEHYRDPSGARGAGTQPGRKGAPNGGAQPLTKEQLGNAMLASWNRSGG